MPDLYLRQRPDGSVYFGPMDTPAPPPSVPKGKLYGINWPLMYQQTAAEQEACVMTAPVLAAYGAMGIKFFRLNLSWSSIWNGTSLNALYLDQVLRSLRAAGVAGAKCLVDLHGEGAWNGVKIGQPGFTYAQFEAFWRMYSGSLWADAGARAGIWGFGILNEPAGFSGGWLGDHGTNSGYQAGIRGVRAGAGAVPWVVVSGEMYTNCSSWNGQYGNEAITLPAGDDRLVIDGHQYADANFSGHYGEYPNYYSTPAQEGCDDQGARYVARTAGWRAWLKAKGYRGICGEFGVPGTAAWMPHLDAYYQMILTTPEIIGGTLWLGGPFAKSNWPWNRGMGVAPGDTSDPHAAVLSKYPTGDL